MPGVYPEGRKPLLVLKAWKLALIASVTLLTCGLDPEKPLPLFCRIV